MFIARLFLRDTTARRVPTILLFGDMRNAYDSILLELVLGPLLTAAERERERERERVLAGTGMDMLRQQSLHCDIRSGHYLFHDLPLPGIFGSDHQGMAAPSMVYS